MVARNMVRMGLLTFRLYAPSKREVFVIPALQAFVLASCKNILIDKSESKIWVNLIVENTYLTHEG